MTIDFGYGVVMDNVEFKLDAAKYVLDNFATQEILDEFNEFRKYNDDITDDDEAKEIFVDEYEDPIYCEGGICGLLVRCINAHECGESHKFAYEDYCIYVGARIPADDDEKSGMLTMDDIRKILAKYLNPILKNNVNVEFLEIHD